MVQGLTRRGVLAAGAAVVAGQVRAQGAARRGGTLRVSVDQAVGVLSPLLTRVNPEYLVSELLYSGLTRLAPDMSAEPDLAQSWSSNAELTEWAFKLRPGVVFSDGSACTARDVVASFRAMLDPKTASPARQNVGPVKSVEAADDGTVLFRLLGPFADLPVALTYTNAKIIPAALAGADMARLGREAVGTGPFKLVAYEPDRRVLVARNEAVFRCGAAVCRSGGGAGLSGPDGGGFGADQRGYGSAGGGAGGGVRAVVVVERGGAAADAFGAVSEREHAVRSEAVERCAGAAGAGADGGSGGVGRVHCGGVWDAGERYGDEQCVSVL